ncbi:MAG TPA: HAMP domain-containing sensor histidine kinase [Candidatus Saccharimonadales bacterium]|nr:HAMP domain-containing sensor histidine kinase [Candidatus Saccharimonadales bacterium]
MSLPLLYALLPTLFFGILAIYFSAKSQKSKTNEVQTPNQEISAQSSEDYTNTIVHDMRAPLTSIKDAAELMVSHPEFTPEERTKMLGVIDTEAKHLLGKIGSILNAAKFEAGKFVFHKTPTDLGHLISQKVQLYMPEAQMKQITLESNVSQTPILTLDAEYIGQVIDNLLSNSLKFTHTGGKITIGLKHDDTKATVWISDTGIGIAKDKQQYLFSKFYEVEDGGGKGTGLGMYIVKEIIKAHNGQVSFESQQGKGTTISFTLPLATAPVQIQTPAPTLPVSQLSN